MSLRPLLGSDRPRSADAVAADLRLWELGPVGGRPRVFLNMVSTADGRATLQGRSGPIGNRADKELFLALRTAVDAVLAGAGTVRAERYGRLVRAEDRRRVRRERGLAEEPLACIASVSLALSPEIPLLADPAARVVLLTPSSTGELPARGASTGAGAAAPGEPPAAGPPSRDAGAGAAAPGEPPAAGPPSRDAGAGAAPSAGAAHVEYVRAARDGQLDLPEALAQLHGRWGVRTVLCEGGPRLNGALLAAGVVDELFLSLAPKLGGGGDPPPPRIVGGPELDPPAELELLQALESESNLLLRYRVLPRGGGHGA